jgi:hypothetical protein
MNAASCRAGTTRSPTLFRYISASGNAATSAGRPSFARAATSSIHPMNAGVAGAPEPGRAGPKRVER